MKRTVFTLFAALLVLLIASCDLFEPPAGAEVNSPNPTDDGREMVRLTINVGDSGTSRALTLAQAKTNVNYYEVVFMDNSGTTYRQNWSGGTTTLDVPAGDYTGPEKAVVFAGRRPNAGDFENMTLLAIGKITNIDGGADLGTSPAVISKTTTGVTFTLIPLESGITDDWTSSSFQILGPTSLSLQTNDGTRGISTYPDALPIPVYTLPAKTDSSFNDNAATSPAGLNSVQNVVGMWAFTNSHFSGVKTKGAWKVASIYPTELGANPQVEVKTIPRFPNVSTTNIIDGNFYFNFNLGNVSGGYSKISMNVPVVAIKDDTSYNGVPSLTWNIRGGTNNDSLDYSTSTDPDGGSVLLYIDSGLVTLSIGTNSL